MKNQFVTIEVAKKLKELGFEEPVLAYWDLKNDQLIIKQIDYGYSKEDGQYRDYYLDEKHSLLAPLWQQVQEWILSNHSLDVHIYPVLLDWTYEVVDLIEDVVHVSCERKDKQKCKELAYLEALEIIKERN